MELAIQTATRVLTAHTEGDPQAADRLLPLVYDELRRLARRILRSERHDHTLQPTALVHEAYLRLIDVRQVDWQGKTHFCAMPSKETAFVVGVTDRTVRQDWRVARAWLTQRLDGVTGSPD